MTRKYKGFTLIELLVVIAIIGILASIVLVSLTRARTRAYDAEIKSELSQIRAAAEMHYMDNNGSYAGFCANTTFTVLTTPSCAFPSAAAYSCSNNATAYAAWANMCSDTAQIWCVDYTGFSGNLAAAPSGSKCQ